MSSLEILLLLVIIYPLTVWGLLELIASNNGKNRIQLEIINSRLRNLEANKHGHLDFKNVVVDGKLVGE